ncbi:MAG TPA: RNA polymerase sigma factor RpoD/SigA [Ignavibacteriaceae bacterium]|nr:RNA polymerase sigma factor RpoD/SigA [Ignavibacteriaceae bacterium]
MKIFNHITNRDSDSLDQYFSEIGKIKLLTVEEEIDLAGKIRNGDLIAREKLIKANLRFVISIAKMYQNKGLPLGDLINEGNLGLIKAARRFDETRGFKFISYAVWWIRQGITSAIADHQRVVRLPLNRIAELSRLNKAYNDLEQKNETEPTFDQLAESLQVSPNEVSFTLQNAARSLSLDAPFNFNDENKNSLLELIADYNQDSPDKGLMNESLEKEVEISLTALDKKEAEIIRLYFGIGNSRGATLEEIGEVFNLTRERIRQLKQKALKKLKTKEGYARLKIYLE